MARTLKKKNEIAKTENTPVTFDGVVTGNFIDIQGIPDLEAYLAYIFMGNDKKGTLGQVTLVRKGEEIPIGKSEVISHICTREMSREFIGKAYTNRLYAPMDDKDEAKTKAWNARIESIENEENENMKRGLVHVVVVIAQDYCTFATIEAFGAMEKYWLKALRHAEYKDRVGFRFTVQNHLENLHTSPKTQRDYFAAWKFKQFSPVKLTEKQQKQVDVAQTEQQDIIGDFLRK